MQPPRSSKGYDWVMADLREQLRAIIAEIAEIDDPSRITDDANLYKELGVDSMQALEIVLELEKRFNVAIPEAKLKEIQTFGDAVSFLTKAVG